MPLNLPDSNHRSEAVLEHSRRSGACEQDVDDSGRGAVIVAARQPMHAGLERHIMGRLPVQVSAHSSAHNCHTYTL